MKVYVVHLFEGGSPDYENIDSAFQDRDRALARWKKLAKRFIESIEDEELDEKDGGVLMLDNTGVLWMEDVELDVEPIWPPE